MLQEVFCKYDAGSEMAIGHRGGTAREAAVYTRILAPLGLGPRLVGTHHVAETGETWLFLEYLGNCLRLSKGPQPLAIEFAAKWIGDFHAAKAAQLDAEDLDFLPHYDADYYVAWADRTAQFSRPLYGEFPWLPDLCKRSRELISLLAEGEQVVIHGEYYPKNICWLQPGVSPIDWETAAVAPGEIDLASLTLSWNTETQLAAQLAYCAARWPDGRMLSPLRLCVAQLYWAMRWLGDAPEWTIHPQRRFWFSEMHGLGLRAGLIL